jgi:flagellar hook-associated protein 3 FlgL
MIRSVDSSAEQFLLGMDRLNKRIEKAQRDVSSGRRILAASDDPDQISRLMQTRAELAQNQQVRTNLGSFKLEEDVAANALESATAVLEKVKSLTSFGINGTLSAEMRTTMIQQVENYMQDMVAIANTEVNGRYIFGGDSDQTAPYQIDFTQVVPVSAYGGSASTRLAMHPDGSRFAISRTGQEIFDNPNANQNVFQALDNLRLGLVNNDSAGIDSAMAQVQSAEEHLTSQSLFYGTVQSRISAAMDSAETRDVRLKSDLGQIQDADLTASIVELKDLQFQRDVTLSSRAKLPRSSLFDYLG